MYDLQVAFIILINEKPENILSRGGKMPKLYCDE